MNIRDEFARLERTVATKEGWQQVNEAWQVALNYEKREDGEWYKKSSTQGDKVTGFAIDPDTLKYEVGDQGRDHHLAKELLALRLIDEGDAVDIDEGFDRVIKGSLATTEGWAFPILLLCGFWDEEYSKLEEFLLNQGVGLPIRGLIEKYQR